MKKKTTALLLFALISVMAFSQYYEIPIDTQYKIFIKILSYDRNLTSRAGDEITIGILYQDKFSKSNEIMNEFVKVASQNQNKKICDLPVLYKPVIYEPGTDLEKTLSDLGVDILYLTPMNAINIFQILDTCQKLDVLSISGYSIYKRYNVSIVLEQQGGKPRIFINLTSAQAEGARFSSRLLSMVKVIR